MSKSENKFETLITYIINEDEVNAKALFHKIVVEKSRDIYESLVDEDQFPIQKSRGRSVQRGLDAESLTDEISDHQDVVDGDERGMQEDEASDEFEVPADDEFGSDEEVDLDADSKFGDEEDAVGDVEAGGEIEDRVMDLEDAIDELKAEFDQLMAGEEAEEENFPGIHDEEGSDEDFDGDADLDSDEADVEVEEPEESASVYEAKDKAKDKAKKDEKEASDKDEKKVKESRKSPADLMREYVEKVTAPNAKSEDGSLVGTGDQSGAKPTVNKKSTQISGKNDMGGSSANIARGGSETAPDGTSPKKASNYGTKGETKVPHAENFENRPGAKAGQTFKKAAKPASKEGAPAGAKNTQGGTVNTKSPDQATGGKPGFKG